METLNSFALEDLIRQQAAGDAPYLEFLNKGSLSMGLYVLPAGSIDGQQPHTEDEVYFVASGRGMFFHAGENVPVQPGAILFVAAGVEHRFHTISEDLQILVFFAPAEYSQAGT